MRTVFSFRNDTPITLSRVKDKLRQCQRKLHPDKVSRQPARVKLLAQKVYYAMEYLKKTMEQGRYPAHSQSANDKPNIVNYPEYYSEDFAAAASTAAESVQLEDLTQPTPGTTRNDSNNRNEGAENDRGEDDQYAPDIDFDDRHGPLKADGSLTDQTGSIPNIFQAANAFDIDDFALSNLRHVLWVPKSCLLLWGQVFSEIT